MRYRFTHNERLASRQIIRSLFSSGSVFYLPPFRVTWMQQPACKTEPVRVLLTVPKSQFRRAVKRNLLRRRMREAYRLNRHELSHFCADHQISLVIGISYTSKEIAGFDTISGKIILILQRLIKENEKVTG